MTPEFARQFLELVKQNEADRSERRIQDMEAHLDASDRVVAQLAQLKAMGEPSGLTPLALALAEAAKSADPL